MSVAPWACQSRKPCATASNPASVRRSAPVAVTWAMQTAIWVSSDHSPGAYGPNPPPTMQASPAGIRGANSYGTPRASPIA